MPCSSMLHNSSKRLDPINSPRDGKKLVSCAGIRNLTVTALALGYFGAYRGLLDLSWVYDNFIPLLTASVLFSFALSALLYAAALRKGAVCAKGGCTGMHRYCPSCLSRASV